MTRRARGHSARRALATAALALGMAFAWPAPAPGQGCSMCRETAAFQKDRAVNALKRGIFALAIPPAAIAIGIFWQVRKRSSRFAGD